MALGAGDSRHAHGCACCDCGADNHQHEDGARALANAVYSAPSAAGEIGALLSGLKWSTTALSYAFPTSSVAYDSDPTTPGVQYGSGEATKGFARLNAAQAAAAIYALDQFAAISGLSFTPAADASDATIRLAQSAAPETAWGYYPSNYEEGGDAWLGVSAGYFEQPRLGGYGWMAILHEVGHALGLSHGHSASGDDQMAFSVMTYRSYAGADITRGYANESFGYAQTLMQADIAAIQALYGANYEHNAGDTVYSWSPSTGEAFVDGVGRGAPGGDRVFETVWDGGGVDTFDFSRYAARLDVDLAPGAATVLAQDQLAWLNMAENAPRIMASGSVFTARLFEGDARSLIENAIGGQGDDEIDGNRAANRLSGGAGADRLFGEKGDDRLTGGAGSDMLAGGSGADRLAGGAGRDTLRGGQGDDRLAGGGGDDRLRGGSNDDRLRGGGGADTLQGGARDDRLRGGDGSDVLQGGAGNDLLTGGGGADAFVFAPGAGADRIRDFRTGDDRIDLSAFDVGFRSLSLAAKAGGTMVQVDGDTILIDGVAPAALSRADFLF